MTVGSAQIPLTDGIWPSLSFVILVVAAATTLLLLWRRFFSRRMLLSRIAELEVLSAAGRAIVASELDVTVLCDLIAREAGKVIENRTFQVGLFEGQFYRIMFWTINGLRQETPQAFDINKEEGLIGWIRRSQTPLLIRDFERDLPSLPASPRYISQDPPRSAIFIPLVSGDESVGVVAAQSDQPNRFSEEDLRRLMILANQSAAAIANARLYEQERMRAAHLELVGQIARQVNAVQDLEEIFDQVVTLTQDTFGFYPVNIFGIDPQTNDAILQASSDQTIPSYSARLQAGRGIVGAASATHETIVSNNTAEDPRFVATLTTLPGAATLNTKAEIAIPLIVDKQVLGVLDVQSSIVGVFSEIEQTVLEALAAEVASAIYKAQQLSWQQGQAWITTAQLQVAEAISRSRDLDDILSAITRLTPIFVGVSRCCILLWDEELQIYKGTASSGSDSETEDAFAKVSVRIGDWHALDAVHVGQQSLNTRQVPPWLTVNPTESNTAVQEVQIHPLIVSSESQPQGVLVVDHFEVAPRLKDGNQAGVRRQELLLNIVNQAAQAIESARLRLAQQEEAWVNTALLQVAEAVNSLIDLNEILDTIVRLVPMLVGVQSVMILIRDDEREIFVPGPSFGVGTMGRGLMATLEIDDQEFRAMTSSKATSNFPGDIGYSIRLPGWLNNSTGDSGRLCFSVECSRQIGRGHDRGHAGQQQSTLINAPPQYLEWHCATSSDGRCQQPTLQGIGRSRAPAAGTKSRSRNPG